MTIKPDAFAALKEALKQNFEPYQKEYERRVAMSVAGDALAFLRPMTDPSDGHCFGCGNDKGHGVAGCICGCD